MEGACFLRSATRPEEFPPGSAAEVAFLGRSNVGKSSLINALAGQPRLAFTSSTPGRTRSVNFYRVGGKVIFVDLPGYGYARVSKAEAAAWKHLIEAYLLNRRELALCILLLDIRRGWMEKDLELRHWLEFHNRRHVVAVTKIDKVKNQTELRRGLEAVRRLAPGAELAPFSALTGQGVRELWQTIWKNVKAP